MRLHFREQWLPWSIMACGVLHTILLLSFVDGEVFFNGDGGLKALFVKQVAAGMVGADLRVPAPQWVSVLWEEGMYPFGPPFVYPRDGAYVIAFPLLFPLLSAPFHLLAGFRGLYVIPATSLWAVWVMVDRIGRRQGASPRMRAGMLATLIFGSPLSLYGAMFWEHTLAVALAVTGFMLAGSARSAARGVLAGLVLGMSAWIRPEMLALIAGAALPLTRMMARVHRGTQGWWALGVLPSVGAFLAVNAAATGNLLGFHGMQVTHGVSPLQHVTASLKLMVKMPVLFVCFFPTSVAMAVSYVRAMRHELAWKEHRCRFLGAAVGLAVLVAMIPNDGGKQWGPRYLLVLVPLLLACEGGGGCRGCGRRDEGGETSSGLRRWCLLAGIVINSVVGSVVVARDYQCRVLPALLHVEREGHSVVAVSHQFVAQELEAMFSSRAVVMTDGVEAFHRLARAMDVQGLSRFTYVCLANRVMPGEMPVMTVRGSRRIVADTPVKRGWFLIYDAHIRR